VQERDAVLGSLARRAATLVEGLNQLEGVSCNAAEGALYAFPRCADHLLHDSIV
jgi:alanine transaminase